MSSWGFGSRMRCRWIIVGSIVGSLVGSRVGPLVGLTDESSLLPVGEAVWALHPNNPTQQAMSSVLIVLIDTQYFGGFEMCTIIRAQHNAMISSTHQND